MNKSQSQVQAIEQLYRQINQIIKQIGQNQTGYFINPKVLIISFENYLHQLGTSLSTSKFRSYLKNNKFGIFGEKICSQFLATNNRLLYLLENSQLNLKEEIYNILVTNEDFLFKYKHFLQDYSLVEVIFLLYLAEQVKRSIFKDNKINNNNKNNKINVLQEVLSILQHLQSNQHINYQQDKQSFTFAINQQKLINCIDTQAQKIMNSKSRRSHKKSPFRQKKYNNRTINTINLYDKNKTINNNLSVVSVESKYQQSIMFENQRTKVKKLSSTTVNDKVIDHSFGYFNSDEVFKSVVLKDYKPKGRNIEQQVLL